MIFINGTITAINKSKQYKVRYEIYIDSEYACTLDRKTIKENKLKVDATVDLAEIETNCYKDEYKSALRYCAWLLERKDYTKASLIEKMQNKMYFTNIIDDVIYYLESNSYVSDKRYGELRARAQIQRGKGKSYIRQYLRSKKIDTDIIEEILSEIDEEFLFNEGKNMALKLAKKEDNKQKVMQKLISRGYNYSDAKEYYEEAIKELDTL